MSEKNLQSMKKANWIDSDFTLELFEFTTGKERDREKAVEKSRSRTTDQREVDKSRKSSDRDSDKKAEAANPWKSVVIVRTNQDGKTRLIPKNDFEPARHELLYGQVSGQPAKPEVTPNVAQEISTQDDFEASKTSNRLLGKTKAQKAPEEEIIRSDRYDYPKDGVEKTDRSSVYPDWDHAIESIPQGLQLVANSTSGRAVDTTAIRDYFGNSQTLMDSSIRAYQQLGSQIKGNFNISIPDDSYPPQGAFLEALGPEAIPTTDLIIQSDDGTVMKVSVVNDKKKLILDDESDLLFKYAMSVSEESFASKTEESTITKKLNALDEKVTNSLMHLDIGTLASKYTLNKIEDLRVEIISTLEEVLGSDDNFERVVVLEALTGLQKFGEGSPASADHLMSMSKDGTNLKLTPLDEPHVRRLLAETTIKIKLDSLTQSPFDMMTTMGSADNKEPQLKEFFDIAEDSNDARLFYGKIMGQSNSKLVGFMQLMNITAVSIIVNNINLEAVGSVPSGDFTKVMVGKKAFYIQTEKDTNYFDGSALNMGEGRDYKKEYKYHGTPLQIKRRQARNSARAEAKKTHGEASLKGKDVDHRDHNPLNNSNGNTRLRSISANRGDNKIAIKTEEHGAGDEGTTLLLLKYLKDTPFMKFPDGLLKGSKKKKDS